MSNPALNRAEMSESSGVLVGYENIINEIVMDHIRKEMPHLPENATGGSSTVLGGIREDMFP